MLKCDNFFYREISFQLKKIRIKRKVTESYQKWASKIWFPLNYTNLVMSQLNLLGVLKWKDVMKLGMDGNDRRNVTSLPAHKQVILSLDPGLLLNFCGFRTLPAGLVLTHSCVTKTSTWFISLRFQDLKRPKWVWFYRLAEKRPLETARFLTCHLGFNTGIVFFNTASCCLVDCAL